MAAKISLVLKHQLIVPSNLFTPATNIRTYKATKPQTYIPSDQKQQNKLDDGMIKPLLNLVIAKYRDLSVASRSGRHGQLRYFEKPLRIIVNQYQPKWNKSGNNYECGKISSSVNLALLQFRTIRLKRFLAVCYLQWQALNASLTLIECLGNRGRRLRLAFSIKSLVFHAKSSHIKNCFAR